MGNVEVNVGSVATPRGLRDVLPEEALWREQIIGAVANTFAEAGYVPVETPILEERELLTESDADAEDTFRLFDSDGSFLMLRPDVTLPIARMISTRLGEQEGPFRLRYCAPVFRESDPLQGIARQFTQLGVELVGEAGVAADAEIVLLMARALEAAGLTDYVLALGSVRPLLALLTASGMDEEWCRQVRARCHRCDLIGLDDLIGEADGRLAPEMGEALRSLVRLRGKRDAIQAARQLTASCGCSECGLDELDELYSRAEAAGIADHISIDFSVMGAFGYYSGMVVEAYVPGCGERLGQGGRYDTVFERFGRPRPAAGFAVSLDALQTALECPVKADRPLRIAVSKGALFDGAIDRLGRAGLPLGDLADPGRQLIVRDGDVEYIIVRPADCPSFVAFGGADCGICGRDSLIEADVEVLELVDLAYGACRFVVAEPADAAGRAEENYRRLGSMRIATKYPRVTRAYFNRIGIAADILKFHGNIELAPLVGMADRIVDITATGTTLRENDLVVVDEVMSCTARFFANPASARTDARVFDLARRLESVAASEERSD